MQWWALWPLVFFIIWLLIDQKTSIIKIALVTLVMAVIEAVIWWKMPVLALGGVFWEGVVVAFDILVIVFGAIFFLELLKKHRVMESLATYLNNFSDDRRIQVILLGWFLEAFLEGIAGFGIPAIVVGPMLLVLGLSPWQAMIIALLGNGVPVPFGAAGTPIRVGLARVSHVDLLSLGRTTARFNMVGMVVPVMMLWVTVVKEKNRVKLFWEKVPVALWAGFLFTGMSYLVSLVGIELPSILGSVLALTVFLLTVKGNREDEDRKAILPLKQVIIPYAVLIALMLLSNVLGWSINPGWLFLVAAIFSNFYFKGQVKEWRNFLKKAGQSSWPAFILIVVMASLVGVLRESGMMTMISRLFTNKFLPQLAPWVGAIGSFVTGSATVSNLMFGEAIHQAAMEMKMDPVMVLAWLLVGGGAGNMIAIADAVAAKAIVGGKESLREIIVRVLPYCVIYLGLCSVLTLIFRG